MSNYRPMDKSYSTKSTVRFIPYRYNKPVIVDKKLYIEPYYFTERTKSSGGNSLGNPKYSRIVNLQSVKQVKHKVHTTRYYDYQRHCYARKHNYNKFGYMYYSFVTNKDILVGSLHMFNGHWYRVTNITYNNKYEKDTTVDIEDFHNPISGHDDRYLISITSGKRHWCK